MLFTELCKALEIHKARTNPYRQSSNGQVERYNRAFMDTVRYFIGKAQNQWHLHLQRLAGAVRASVNRHGFHSKSINVDDMTRAKLKTATNKMKRNYDLRILEYNYEVGDLVHILDEASVKGQCEKLRPSWKGPGIIERKFPSNVFRVKLRDAIMVLNHEQIKPCRGRAFPAWIRQWKESLRTKETMINSG